LEHRWNQNCRIFDKGNNGTHKRKIQEVISCKECPWTKNNPHSLKWREYSKKVMVDKPHACHMKTKDVWGKKEGISSSCACVGSINHLRKEK
jgi:hypothetical protein